MNDHQSWSVDTLFDAAMEQPSASRTSFVRTQCPDNEQMAQEVVSLIGAHDRAGTFLGRSAIEEDPGLAGLADPNIRQTIGPYRIVRLIAIGGMGRVYLAERIDGTFTRNVAIKIIRQDIGTDDIVRRFNHERKVLAQLDHPNIARLVDGGSTDNGLPYLVMDYVDGQPITVHCDKHRLNVHARLELFQTVCDAVQFAHRNLVIHRDLKPSNILVTADGTVKLLDFGIAKVVSPSENNRSDLTVTRERRLTPAYASPEQMRSGAVTTASDVFSLGVILYELLTGHRPHQTDRLSFEQASRAICDDSPPRPSTAVVQTIPHLRATPLDDDDTTSTTPEEIAVRRGTDPIRLRRTLRGDLENIILMALRKEPERRYATVEQFVQDIDRYRRSLPVLARPDTMRYRMSKFIARNCAGVVAAATLLVVLVGATSISMTQYLQASYERDRAQLAEQRAERRFAEVRELANTMLFEVHDSIRTLPGSTGPSRAIVTTAHQYLEGLLGEAIDDPELLLDIAAAYRRLGDIQGGLEGNPGLGDITGAMASYNAGYELVEELLAANPDVDAYRISGAALLFGIGICHSEMSQLDEARDAFARGRALRQQVRSDAHRHAYPMPDAFLHEMAKLRVRLGDFDGALQSYEQQIEEVRQAWLGHQSDPQAKYHIGMAHLRLGELLLNLRHIDRSRELLDLAVELFETAVAIQPANRDYRRMRINALWLIGQFMVITGELEDGIAFLEELTEQQYDMLASDPLDRSIIRDIATSHRYLGEYKISLGLAEEGLEHYDRAVALRERLVELDNASVKQHRDLAAAIDMQATALWRVERFDEAMTKHVEAKQVFEQLVLEHPGEVDLLRSVGVSEFHLGELNAALGRHETTTPEDRLRYLHKAINHYARAIHVMTEIRDSRRLQGSDAHVIPMLEQRIDSIRKLLAGPDVALDETA